MASTYGNDLRLEEIGDGEQSGSWGATTNTNLGLIAEALSFGTEAITTNADSHTTHITDGASDPGRSLYLKYTGALDSTCTITITPEAVSKVWYIENGTSGSQSIIISCGSGANVTIPTGQTKVVYSDGSGAMAEIGTLGVTNLNVSGDITVGDDLTVTDDMTVGGTLGVTGVLTGTSLDISGNVDIDGTTNLDAVDIDGAVQVDATVNVGVDDTGYDVKFFGDTASAYMQWDASADDLILGGAAGIVVPDGKLTLGSTAVTSTGAELNILDGVTSTATELNQLDAITRGSILYGNASGATARLAKGGAATVPTSDGTDISWAAAGGGGGEQTFTASGAISNGAIVGLNLDGTISTMSQKAGSPTDASSADVNDPHATNIAYDSTNNKVLYVYMEDTQSQLFAVVGTVSGLGISFGTPASVQTSVARGSYVCFDSNAGKFAIIYAKSSTIKAKVATISGTSVSFGSEASVDSEPMQTAVGATVFDPDQNAIIFARLGSGNDGRISAGAISGTSISWGSTVEYSTDYMEDNLSFDLTYDTSANKTILVYKRYINTTSGDIYYRTVTTSGTSISLGTQRVLYASTSLYAEPRCVYSPAANKTFFAYAQGSSLETVVGTLSGDTFSFGTTNSNISGAPVSGTAQHRRYDYNPDTEEIIETSGYFYSTFSTANYKIVGTDNFASTSTQIFAKNGTIGVYNIGTCYDTGSNKVVVAYRDDSDSDKAKALVYDPAIPTNWVGLAGEAISNGASGKVTIIGGINTGQSGLVAGVSYRVTTTSSSLSQNTGTVVGTALSASSLYLTKAGI